ncbi:MAG: hypothetical protein JHC89_00300 [Acetobacteraceae bacterium]|jgi:hypothetical protein|nr:hypothetical protein [Acetobacteraceae bacterium]
MRYLTKTSLLATGLAFALTGAALAQGTASTVPVQGSRPAAQAPATAKPGDATNGQVRGHQGNGQTRAVTPAAPAGGATR